MSRSHRSLLYILRDRCGVALGVSYLLAGMALAQPVAHLDRAQQYYESGRFEAAIEAWDRALGELPALSDSERTAIMVRQGQAYIAAGYVERSLPVLRNALTLAGEDPPAKAVVLGTIGRAEQARGDLAVARASMNASVELARAAGRPRIEAAAINNLANLLALTGEREAALAHHEANIVLTQGLDVLLHVQALTNAARLTRELGRGGEAESLLHRANARTSEVPPMHAGIYALLALGELNTQLHEKKLGSTHAVGAYGALERALKSSETVGDRYAQSYALGFLSRLYALQGRNSEALQLNDSALLVARELDAPELLYRWYWDRGRLLRAQQAAGPAIDALRHAVVNLQLVRHDIFVAYVGGRSSFREVQGPLYFELADSLLREAAKTADRNVAQSYLREARDTVERSKSAELQDYFQDTCVATLQAQKAAPDGVSANTAVVYPVLLQDRIELLVAYADVITQYPVAVSANELSDTVRRFRLALERRTTRQYLPLAQKLHEWLIQPLVADLDAHGIDTLVFIPDGALRTVPMAALHDGKRYLIERYAIANSPGLTLTDARPSSQRGGLVLSGLTESVQGFPPLPYVANEMDTLLNLKQGRVLRDQDFVHFNLERAIGERPVSIVHMATHGVFRADSAGSFILTHDGKLTLNELEKLIAPTRFRSQPIDLLTLSACQTAAGDDRAALGLGGIAVKSGAKAALATLWFISDQSSAALVSDFYRTLLSQVPVTKARALQQAQVNMLKDGRFNHPGYWAPFLLIGNWL